MSIRKTHFFQKILIGRSERSERLDKRPWIRPSRDTRPHVLNVLNAKTSDNPPVHTFARTSKTPRQTPINRPAGSKRDRTFWTLGARPERLKRPEKTPVNHAHPPKRQTRPIMVTTRFSRRSKKTKKNEIRCWLIIPPPYKGSCLKGKTSYGEHHTARQ